MGVNYEFTEMKKVSPQLELAGQNLTTSEFLMNYARILKDEEFLTEDDKFLRCFYCDNEEIESVCCSNLEEFTLFLKDFCTNKKTLTQNLNEINKWLEYAKIAKNISFENTNTITVQYCKTCKTILKINSQICFVKHDFTFGEEKTLLIQDGFIDQDGSPIKCVHCRCEQLEVTNEVYENFGTAEYDVVCSNCGEILGHWNYGYFC